MAGPWDDYAPQAPAATVPPWEEYGAQAAKKTEAAMLKGAGWDKIQNYSGTDAIAGAVRGAGSIGASIVDRLRSSASHILTAVPENMRPKVTGDLINMPRGDALRTGMDQGLTSLGANPESTAYQTNKLMAEIAGTSGLGGGLGSVLARIPGLAKALPSLLPAIQTGGMTAGGAMGLQGIVARGVGGAINGGATAGLVNPEDVGTGAMIGGAFPVAAKLVAGAGKLMPKPSAALTQNPTTLQTAKESMDAGYIIPPSMLKPTLGNRILESTSGKQGTAQMASTQNQAVTEGLARKALGLPADAPLTFATMQNYRAAQHQAGYEPLRQVGMIPAGQKFDQALTDIANQYTGKGTIPALAKGKQEITDLVNSYRSTGFDAGDAVDAIRVLREDSSALYKSANASDKAQAKATRSIADAFEGAIDDALTTSGQKDLLNTYREARQNIAKSGSVEKAIREGSGTLDARKLATELQKGKPLTGELKTIAKFANVFDKAAQPPQLIGSPAVHNLTATLSTGGGATGAGLGAWFGGPVGAAVGGAAGAAYPYVVPPLARARMFSESAQRGLLSAPNGPSALRGLLSDASDEALPLLYRSGGLLGNGN